MKTRNQYVVNFPDVTMDQRDHYRYIISKYIYKTLIASEIKVMEHIMLETLHMFKIGKIISVKQITEELNVHINTVYRALESLVDKKLIFTDFCQNNRFIVINMGITDIGYNPNSKSKTEWKSIHQDLGIINYRSNKQLLEALRRNHPVGS